MKKLYGILSCTLLFAICANSQPVISNLNVPAFNTKLTAKVKTGVVLDPGSEGANQIWDFSGYDSTGSTKTVSTIVDPSKTPYASEFAGATYAELTGQGNYNYTKITSSESISLGNTGTSPAGTVLIKYSDPAVSFKFPFSYQQTFTDNFAATYGANGVTTQKTGYSTFTYTGYGTLKTVYGTFNNVVRLKVERKDTDAYTVEGERGGTEIISTGYSWYLPGTSHALFAISETKITPIYPDIVEIDEEMLEFLTQKINMVYLFEPGVLTANQKPAEIPAKTVAGPNPATDHINLDLANLETGTYSISLVDELGKQVYTTLTSDRSVTIPTQDFSKGIYIAKISGENVMETLRIVVK